jgi:lipopolysaccharide transport system ATP-binding protein
MAGSFRKALNAARSPARTLFTRDVPDAFWALHDVSFEVGQGEVVGIIGSNGAGKSTLLKILSRITPPTVGHAWIRGRVGSLLEVGTGFHPELTGRENTYLNGAILGMRRAEIDRKLDEIVAFAEVERFIDTPVKHYSSGMYLRLAFAVAAHLEPEILIVDEVLAVGDAAFQKKSLGKMSDVAHAGRTVLFVSHNMDAVKRLCSRCVLLERGRLILDADTNTATARYLSSSVKHGGPDEWIDFSGVARTGTGDARIVALRYSSSRDEDSLPYADGPLFVTLDIRAEAAMLVRCLSLILYDAQGNKLVNAEIASHGLELPLREGRNLVRFSFERLPLNRGVYMLGWWMGRTVEEQVPLDYVMWGTSFELVEREPEPFAYPWAIGPVACRFTVTYLSGSTDA